MITAQEYKDILKGTDLMNSSANDIGELVFRPFRMCGFVPMNVPLLVGILFSPPTMKHTFFWQWLN